MWRVNGFNWAWKRVWNEMELGKSTKWDLGFDGSLVRTLLLSTTGGRATGFKGILGSTYWTQTILREGSKEINSINGIKFLSLSP